LKDVIIIELSCLHERTTSVTEEVSFSSILVYALLSNSVEKRRRRLSPEATAIESSLGDQDIARMPVGTKPTSSASLVST
jgi:hypothetical protein